MDYKSTIMNWFDANGCRMTEISDKIWNYAETLFQEYQSSAILADELEQSGFRVTRGVADIETAFTAEWSNGNGPVIALLGEYDALPGLGNELVPEKKPNGKNGHGCGHNLLGVGSMAAAISLRQAMIEHDVKGTIRYYGCPAEEGGGAKVFMVRDGLFQDIDAVVRWHPIHITHVPLSPCFSTRRGVCIFRYKSQYLGLGNGSQLGRNALNAAILMDLAVNYLKDNVPKSATLRTMITKAGVNIGVNPTEVEVQFRCNTTEGEEATEIFERMVQIANGVAAATGTEVEIRCTMATTRTLPNKVLCEAMLKNLLEVGPPAFSQEDKNFAAKMTEHLDQKVKAKSILMFGITDPEVSQKPLHEGISTDMLENIPVTAYCTDSGDVSWQAPMCQCFIAGQPIGSTNHSWQQVVSSGMGIGHACLLTAGKTIAMTAMNILTDPYLLEQAKKEFNQKLKEHPYVCPIPNYAKPGASYAYLD